jgi:hypothetical protein
VDYSINFRDSQAYSLGAVAPAGPAHFLQFTAARDITLGQLNLVAANANTLAAAPSGGLTSYGNQGTVTALTCQGASLMVSNQNAPLRAFSPIAQDGENNYIGLQLPNAGTVTVNTINVAGAPALTGGIFTEPYDVATQGPVLAPNDMANQGGLNYVCGLGQVVTAPGVAQVVQLNCQVLRGVTLGWLYLEAYTAAGAVQNFGDEGQLSVTQVLVNQTEYLASQVGTPIPFSQFTLGSTDSDARYLGAPCPLNSTVIISINVPAAVANALTIQGMFFCAHA